MGAEQNFGALAPALFYPRCPQVGFAGGRAKKSGVAPRKVSATRHLLGHMGGGARKSVVAPRKVSATRHLIGHTGGGARKNSVPPKITVGKKYA